MSKTLQLKRDIHEASGMENLMRPHFELARRERLGFLRGLLFALPIGLVLGALIVGAAVWIFWK